MHTGRRGADYRRHSLSPVVPPSVSPPPRPSPLQGNGGSITGPSVTSRRPIGVDESIVPGHSIGPRYHPGVLNVPPPSSLLALHRTAWEFRRSSSLRPLPSFSSEVHSLSASSHHRHPFATPAAYMFYPLSSIQRRRLIGTRLYLAGRFKVSITSGHRSGRHRS